MVLLRSDLNALLTVGWILTEWYQNCKGPRRSPRLPSLLSSRLSGCLLLLQLQMDETGDRNFAGMTHLRRQHTCKHFN